MWRYIVVLLAGVGAGSGGYFIAAQGSDVERVLVEEGAVSVCSFNVQFLGNSERRDDEALAGLLQDCDVVAVQELVSPPYAGTFPGGTDPFNPDPQSAEFFDAMVALGFQYVMSEEDTGPGDEIHRNGSATEWWVTFYNPNRIEVAGDLPHGFLADDRSANTSFERVPYAFGFRTPESDLDFVLISVHFRPGTGPANRARRLEEINAVAAWIDINDEDERDFIILGDMNWQNKAELISSTPCGYVSLNNHFLPTNTQLDDSYDHAILSLYNTSEVDLAFGFVVLDLREALRDSWTLTDPYPGDPYDHNRFRAFYSDHNPVMFRLMIPTSDDDT